ncbi:MAG TPA: phosphotransacetylase family protein, partial [Chloroflexi bacterium]|nr:phosphotransacetylase family protein [Chloroflexota bacterium]
MAIVYVTSIQKFSGKSALCVGLGKRLLKDGYSFCYMKPVSTMARLENGEVVDDDALFLKRLFNLPQSINEMVPITLTPQTVEAILRGKVEVDFEARLKEAFSRCGKDKDVLLLEGGGTLREGYIVNLSTPYVAKLLGAKELVVIKYDSDLSTVDDALTAKHRLGDSMLGVVLNRVPKPRMQFVEEVVRPYLERHGVRVFAVLPHERLLASISVGELAKVLDGEILCCPERSDELVEHIMVGAMTVDAALSYFRRRPNKAVITGGDRPDIQLAALETSTRCVILTGNLRPSPIILGRAEEVGVPMMLVRHDTFTTVEIIEQFFGKSRFYQ